MKRILSLLFILTILFFIADQVHADDLTKTLKNTDFPNGEISMELNSSGNPVIAYGDTVGIRLISCNDPQCNSFSDQAIALGHSPSLELNNNDLPSISYYQSSHLVMAICDTPQCDGTITTHQISSPRNDGEYNSLALDSSGNPMIAYYSSTDSSLRYLYCISSPTCSSGILLGGELDNSADVGKSVSMVIDQSGYPVISYFDSTNGDLKLALCSNSSCTSKAIITVDSAGNVGGYPSLALDSNDNPVISYADASNDKLKVVICGNATCTSGNIYRSFYTTGGVTSSFIALTSGNIPIISYSDGSGLLNLLVCGESTCDTNNNNLVARVIYGDAINALNIGETPIVLNASNTPYVSYVFQDLPEQGLNLTVADIIHPTITSITRASASPTSSSSINFNVNFSEPITGLNSSNFTLTTKGINGAAITNVSGSGSTYTVTVSTGTGNGSIQLVMNLYGSVNDTAGNGLIYGILPFKGETYSVVRNQTFQDVPTTYWAWQYIERLYIAGITGGCSSSPLNYCPTDSVTRAQMAIFLEKGMHGSSFSPPNVAATFTDTSGHWAEDWIEALKNDGITSGCGIGIYCPDASVTRAQMAVFLLKAKYGSGYVPMNSLPTFNDTAGHWAEDWIEQLAVEGITSGCAAGLYCPDNSVTRDQMAVFLVKAFNLP